MSQKEFIDQLEGLLRGIPREERDEALQYYADYFEDAGEENEAKVITELGSPENVANMIKADLQEDASGKGEFTENGYRDIRFEQSDSPVPRPNRYRRAEGGYTYRSTEGAGTYSRRGYKSTDYSRNTYGSNYGSNSYGGASDDNGTDGSNQREKEPPRTSRTLKIVLIILIVLVAIPFTGPFLIAIAGLVIGLVIAAFALFIGLAIGTVALMASGIFVAILGLTKLFVELPVAFLTMGIGFIIFVVGMIATVAAVKLCILVIPAIFKAIVEVCRWPFHRKGYR